MSKKLSKFEGKGEIKIFFEGKKDSLRIINDEHSFYIKEGKNRTDPNKRFSRMIESFHRLHRSFIGLYEIDNRGEE